MKTILLILILTTFTSYASEIYSVRHNGQLLQFEHHSNGDLNLKIDNTFKGKFIISEDFVSKKDCKYFKVLMEDFVEGRDIEEISPQEFLKQRNLILPSMSQILQPYEVTLLPFGVDLEDKALHAKLARKMRIDKNNEIFTQINRNLNFKNLIVNYDGSYKGILSLYSKETIDEVLSFFSNEFNYNNKGINKGVITFDSKMFETTCDLLYSKSSVSFNITTRRDDQVVEKVKVSKDRLSKLFHELQKVTSESSVDERDRDSFVAGMELAKAVHKSQFIYPKRLKQIFGNKKEIDFYRSLFGDKQYWLPGEMTNNRQKRLLSNNIYIKTEPGKVEHGETRVSTIKQ